MSGAWLAGAAGYVDGHIGWENLAHQHPTELAALMAGIFAPLALLWLLVAYFRQANSQRHLAFALKQLHWQARKSAEQTETIVRALAETQDHERHAASLQVLDRSLADLQSLAARLTLGFGRLAPRDQSAYWRMTKAGDRFAFFNCLLGDDPASLERRDDMTIRLQESPDLRPLIEDYVQLQERLADFAAKRQIDPLLREGLEHGPPAKLRALLLSVLRSEPQPEVPQPLQAQTSNPSAALTAHRVAQVLWPQGVAKQAFSPSVQPPANAQATPPPVEARKEEADRPADSEAPAPSPSPGNVTPFSPLAPGFPRHPGP